MVRRRWRHLALWLFFNVTIILHRLKNSYYIPICGATKNSRVFRNYRSSTDTCQNTCQTDFSLEATVILVIRLHFLHCLLFLQARDRYCGIEILLFCFYAHYIYKVRFKRLRPTGNYRTFAEVISL